MALVVYRSFSCERKNPDIITVNGDVQDVFRKKWIRFLSTKKNIKTKNRSSITNWMCSVKIISPIFFGSAQGGVAASRTMHLGEAARKVVGQRVYPIKGIYYANKMLLVYKNSNTTG